MEKPTGSCSQNMLEARNLFWGGLHYVPLFDYPNCRFLRKIISGDGTDVTGHSGKNQLGERNKKHKDSEVQKERRNRDCELVKRTLGNPDCSNNSDLQ